MELVIQRPRYEASLFHNGHTMFIVINGDENTDAAPGHQPLQSQRVPNRDANGAVNYYEEADETVERLWREKLGRYLFEHVVKEDMRKEGLPVNISPNKVFLAQLPKHYSLWVHKKGNPHDPRKDVYLYGSRFVAQFRSPMEFCLHLKWILDGQPKKRRSIGKPACKCCWCDGSRTQGEISKELGTYHPNERHPNHTGGGRGRGGSSLNPPLTIPYKDYTNLNSTSS